MKLNIKFIGIAIVGLLMLTASCQKELDKLEEDFGVVYTVEENGKSLWTNKTESTSIEAVMEHSRIKLTLKDGSKEVVLYAKEFEKGKYIFDQLKHASSGMYKDASSTYEGAYGGDNYIEIKYIHTDGKLFDGKFSFVCANSSGDTKTISGNWYNVEKK
jgi:hypothetical protein